MKKFIYVLGFTALISACSNGGGSGVKPEVKPQVEKSDAEFYDQFKLDVVGDCKDPSKMMFKFLESDPVSLGRTAEGFQIIGRIDVYLIDEKRFGLAYREVKILEGDFHNYRGINLDLEIIYLDYKIENGKIILGNLGVGERSTSNGQDVIAFVYSDNFLDYKDVSRRSTVLRLVHSKRTFLKLAKDVSEVCAQN